MDKIIQLFIMNGYNLHKQETLEKGFPVYVCNWNGVRHWVENKDNTIRMLSIPEGTDGETYLMDTGTLTNPSINFIREQVEKAKTLM